MLCVFLDFGHFGSINVIFIHFQRVMEKGWVLFYYSSRYTKVIGASQDFMSRFCIKNVCLLIFWEFSGSYIVLFYWSRYFNVIGSSWYVFEAFFVFFMCFSSFLRMYYYSAILKKLQKRSKGLLCYSSHYYMVICARQKNLRYFFIRVS